MDLERDPVIEVYKRDVDQTLLDENLRKTPDQRVRALRALLLAALELQRAGEALRDAKAKDAKAEERAVDR